MQRKSFIASLAAIAVIVIALGLLAVPGFAKLSSGTATFSGYEAIFHYAYRPTLHAKNAIAAICPNSKAIGIDIVALVFLAIAVVSYAFSKKSSVLPVVGGVLTTLASVIFLSNALWIRLAYKNASIMELAWSTYLIGALLIVAGVATLGLGVKSLLEEKNTLSSSKSYSYLRNK